MADGVFNRRPGKLRSTATWWIYLASNNGCAPLKILDVYIARHVVAGSLLCLGLLVALFSFVAFVYDIGRIGAGYGIDDAMINTLLTLPRLSYELFPVAAAIGSMIGLGGLAATSQLVVIRAAGVSVPRIAVSALCGAAVLVLSATFIGEVIAPYSERSAQSRRAAALGSGVGGPVWLRSGSKIINIDRILSDNRMRDVRVYEFDANNHLRVITHAREVRYVSNHWLLSGIERSTFEPDRVRLDKIEQETWVLDIDPGVVGVTAEYPESLSLVQLSDHINYLEQNNLATDRIALAFWIKIFYPLATGAMVLLATSLVLGWMRGNLLGKRILIGSFLGIGFHVLNRMSGQGGIVWGISPVWSAAAPTLLLIIIAVYLLRRVR